MSRFGKWFLDTSLAAASRILLTRDAWLGVTKRLRKHPLAESFSFASEGRNLSAVYVPPEGDAPVILLCHGIGETVEHWSAAQALLRDRGVGSMVFNYSGYARSEGRLCAANCDADFAAAYAELCRRAGKNANVYVLGFSLSSGIAAANVALLQPPPAGLFLCEAFTSFRDAACETGIPRWLANRVPDVWNTVERVASLRVPLYVVHSTGDRLFPVTMAERIAVAAGGAELVLIEGLGHNEPFLKAVERYWEPILQRMA